MDWLSKRLQSSAGVKGRRLVAGVVAATSSSTTNYNRLHKSSATSSSESSVTNLQSSGSSQKCLIPSNNRLILKLDSKNDWMDNLDSPMDDNQEDFYNDDDDLLKISGPSVFVGVRKIFFIKIICIF